MVRRLAILLATTTFVSCAPAPRTGTSVAPGPARDAATVTILHLNDVYEITPVEGGRSGGLARVATLRQQLAAAHAPLLTTLGGDFLSPSALGTARVDGQALAGRQMVAVLNAVGLDWTTLGNHEFDIAYPQFLARLGESRFRYVVSNATDTAGRPFPGIVAHAVVRLEGGGRTVRIGLIGLVTSANRAAWVRYADPYDAAKQHVAMLRDSVDAIVALTHLSVAEDQRLAGEVPQIDLILGGHEHENYLLRRGPRFTPIIKADANVRSVAVVTLHWSGVGQRQRPTVSSELLPITDSIAEDRTVSAEVTRWLDVAFAGYARDGFAPREVVAKTLVPLDGRESTVRTRSGLLTDLILAAMRGEAPDAEVAVFNGGSVRIDDEIPPGPVTQYDIIRILPFGGKLVRADISGRLLNQILQQGRQNSGTGGFLHASGTLFDGDQLRVGGAPVENDRRYRVVLTDFLLSGREIGLSYLTTSNADVRIVRELRDVRMALIDELKK